MAARSGFTRTLIIAGKDGKKTLNGKRTNIYF